MKITLIQPFYPNIWEPLWAGMLTSYLKQVFHEDLDVRFFHGNFDNERSMVQEGVKSDIVAFSCTTPTFQNGYEIAKKIKAKNPNVFIVFGGWHVTALKDELLDNRKFWDIVSCIIVGEGEKAFINLIHDFEVYKHYHHVVLVSHKTTFNELPWPDRQLIRQDRTLKLCEDICGERIASFQSRRGCPMHCKICAEHCMSGKGVRVRNTYDLLEEIKSVHKQYSISMFKFVDPTWGYPKSAIIDFCEKKGQIIPNLPWEAMCHASFLDRDLLQLMKNADCKQINIGCESGSQKILNDMNKGLSIEKIKKVFKWGHELGIEMRSFFILGMPNETLETIEETKILIREIKPDHLGCTILCPYPGSSFYDREKYKDVDWSNADEYSNNFWKTSNFTNRQLKDTQKDFTNEFNDKIVWHQRLINND